MSTRWFHGSRAAFWREPGDGGPGGKNQRAGHATHGSTVRRASGFVVGCWRRGLVSRPGSDVVGCAQPSGGSAGRACAAHKRGVWGGVARARGAVGGRGKPKRWGGGPTLVYDAMASA